MARVDWWSLSDAELLAQCEEDRYRASGPGGQKRNKTDSAVRLRHRPTNVLVTAVESRSSHENRRRAVRRLRAALAYDHREAVDPGPSDSPALDLSLPPRDPQFLAAAAVVLDWLAHHRGQMGETARQLGLTTAELTRFLHTTTECWRSAQQLRQAHGLKPLSEPRE